MIIRTWGARTDAVGVSAYLEHFNASVLPALEALPGFLGFSLLESLSEPGASVSLLLTTRWESIDDIRRFAGDDYTRAVVEPAAAAVLLEYDRVAEHYRVAAVG